MHTPLRSILPLFLLLIVNTLSASMITWRYHILSTGIENKIYFYHGDHLGSAHWITDSSSVPIQYIHYAPYGELIANQTPYNYNERYKFTGKERDQESGYDYFGARYYWSDYAHFITPDPLSDNDPGISSYAYCHWNPIGFVDPDGEEWLTDEDAQQASKYTQAMENKITQLSKQMARAKSEEKQTTLSQRISSLRAGINELNEMGEMPDVKFTYNNLSETAEEGYTEFLDENTIVMAVPQGSIALGIHESSHGYDYAKQRGVYYEYEKIPGEIKAYQRQFSFHRVLYLQVYIRIILTISIIYLHHGYSIFIL